MLPSTIELLRVKSLSQHNRRFVTMVKGWSDLDNAKLAQLFRTGKLDPSKIDNKSIHKALKFFEGREYPAFAAT
jgi:hypothetical protein